MRLSELLHKFDEQNLSDAMDAVSWDPEEAAGFRGLKKWAKETSTYQYIKSDISKSCIWRMDYRYDYRYPRRNPFVYLLSKYGDLDGQRNEALVQFLVAEASQKPPKVPHRLGLQPHYIYSVNGQRRLISERPGSVDYADESDKWHLAISALDEKNHSGWKNYPQFMHLPEAGATMILGLLPGERLKEIIRENPKPHGEPVGSELIEPIDGSVNKIDYRKDENRWLLIDWVVANYIEYGGYWGHSSHPYCWECDSYVIPGAERCHYCSEYLPTPFSCQSCRYQNPAEAKFCMSCGEKR